MLCNGETFITKLTGILRHVYPPFYSHSFLLQPIILGQAHQHLKAHSQTGSLKMEMPISVMLGHYINPGRQSEYWFCPVVKNLNECQHCHVSAGCANNFLSAM